MSEEILINITPPETRVALIENGVVQEVMIERASSRGIVGNIYNGRVCRVLPGMQAAFVEIGLDKAAFLHASDIIQHQHEENGNHNITELLREGENIIVQVTKDPLGSKGARLTTGISLPSRYLVFMPSLSTVGVSQKIDDEVERQRLREAIDAASRGADGQPGRFIARTVAEGIDEETLLQDMRFLTRLWESIQERLATAQPQELLHEDLPLAMRAIRDLINPKVEKIRIDSRETWNKAKHFAEKLIPDMTTAIEYYPGECPIFDLYGVEDEIQKALNRKVELKSGGYIIIDQTEAMTTIDVNTGAFVGHSNLEETIFKTNLEAAQTICRQLRLRNLGGIIIVDFIDMQDEEHKRQVLRTYEKCLAHDNAKTKITEVSSLGLVEMTRKRTRESLGHVLCEPCPCCGGRGSLKTAKTTCYEIFREVLRESRQFEVESMLILASPAVVELLLDEESTNLANLEQFANKTIRLQAETLYSQEHYDIVLL
jgi:ribonuclease G